MKLCIATCQFAIGGDPAANTRAVLRQMGTAKARGAHIVHFPETALSGYAGKDIKSVGAIDWDVLINCTETIMAAAKKMKLWVVVGSAHRLTGKHKPHNSLYIISDKGDLVERYDKMFCTGDSKAASRDLLHYSPGDHLCVFTVKGLTCGALICHDFRYQELFREYKRKGVQVLFHSYHNGHLTKEEIETNGNIHGVIVPPTMQAYAANNYMWISANNTSRKESSWPGFFVQPDGVISGRLSRNKAGVLISEVDTAKKFYDASVNWRDRAMKGIYHSGKVVKDGRSSERCEL
ncbi:MAG: carbon-nitrogen hydrolase family protein [Spirochaetales bacterium]|jgi:deaminated glutathione amidase|nr:carbon-nitrogen hydrolase family protein [Spirochaetales bacterium]